MYFNLMYSVLNKLSEHIYFYMSKSTTLYTFVVCFWNFWKPSVCPEGHHHVKVCSLLLFILASWCRMWLWCIIYFGIKPVIEWYSVSVLQLPLLTVFISSVLDFFLALKKYKLQRESKKVLTFCVHCILQHNLKRSNI